MIDLDDEAVRITLRRPGAGEEPLAEFSLEPVTTSRFHPALDRFVRYDPPPSLGPGG